MKRFCLLVCLVVVGLISSQAWAEKAPKVHHLRVPVKGWIAGFDTGSSELGSAQLREIQELQHYLINHPEYDWFGKGSVSGEIIVSGLCYTSADGYYFSLRKTDLASIKITGEEKCEIALGYSRDLHVQAALTGTHYFSYGIDLERTHVFQEVDFYQRPGGHEDNRAVKYWLVPDLPKGTELNELKEDPQTGDLLIDYVVPKKSWCQTIEQWWQDNIPKIPKPHFRYKERQGQPLT